MGNNIPMRRVKGNGQAIDRRQAKEIGLIGGKVVLTVENHRSAVARNKHGEGSNKFTDKRLAAATDHKLVAKQDIPHDRLHDRLEVAPAGEMLGKDAGRRGFCDGGHGCTTSRAEGLNLHASQDKRLFHGLHQLHGEGVQVCPQSWHLQQHIERTERQPAGPVVPGAGARGAEEGGGCGCTNALLAGRFPLLVDQPGKSLAEQLPVVHQEDKIFVHDQESVPACEAPCHFVMKTEEIAKYRVRSVRRAEDHRAFPARADIFSREGTQRDRLSLREKGVCDARAANVGVVSDDQWVGYNALWWDPSCWGNRAGCSKRRRSAGRRWDGILQALRAKGNSRAVSLIKMCQQNAEHLFWKPDR